MAFGIIEILAKTILRNTLMDSAHFLKLYKKILNQGCHASKISK